MSNYRMRPKANYIQEANWKDLYLLTNSWKNDLEFCFSETAFFASLIETHLYKLLLHNNLNELRALQIEVFELKNQCEYLQQCVLSNLESIANIIKGTYLYNTSELRVKNEHLENDMLLLINNEKAFKRVVFNMAKAMLKSQKPKQVWMFN